MSAVNSASTKDGKQPGFWKKGSNVPGSDDRMKVQQKKDMAKGIKKDSFHDFEHKTSDAWDDGDDDLLVMANIQMSLKDVRTTAKAVLDNHSHMTAIPSATSSHGAGPGVGIRLNSGWKPPKTTPIRLTKEPVPDREAAKLEKFKSVLAGPNTDLDELRKLSWSGIPKAVRPTAWKILSGYLPASVDRREPTLQRKRNEYFGFIEQYYETRHEDMHQETFRQILKDIPRMTSLAHLFQQKVVQEIFERILFIWAIRHPASGYVQGINDLVTPFFVVFLSEYIDNAPLNDHIQEQHVEYLQFAFRWMNNLLMREIPLRCTIRLWDTYQSELNGFADFHLYLCAAFLVRFSKDIQREKDFQGILMLLQNLPTHHWQNDEIGELLAEAFKLKYMFADAPNHLSKKK
ncbi:hypothetical protein KUTeg_020512 [Tegillarca granosa]|uniref:Rab-GAP TBC domain-containing protein n=1 Tax=Tegillarca granosa TaxID=220873 RepID=A0ABQ9EDD9_TEGGR|nr:hypothetical protein KUTeg_020512 [Tegillarca granosa]